MRRIFILFGMLFFFSAMIKAQDMKLEDVLDKYFRVNGFNQLQGVQTVIMNGTLVQNDVMPVKIVKKRPDKYLMEFDVADITGYQVFDGKTAWMTAPWTGNPKPQLMNEERAGDLKNRADFDGLLFDWKVKGHSAELVGMDSIAKMPVYKIKLIRKDKGIEYYFIDPQGYLLQKRVYYRIVRGKETEVENYFRDYRKVEGVIFPFMIEATMGGQPYSSIQYDSIEMNVPVEDKIFQMPGN
jgi:hypothetical protein